MFTVEILRDQPRLGLKKSEHYRAEIYPLDRQKYTIFDIDGDPICNQYKGVDAERLPPALCPKCGVPDSIGRNSCCQDSRVEQLEKGGA
jgi:hypothetical protein